MVTKSSELFNQIEANKGKIEFLSTGFTKIDNLLDGGFLRKELVVLGAGTGIGKSYVAGQIFYNIATKGFNSAYFSLEISSQMVVSRLAGSLSNIKPTRIMCGLLNEEEYKAKNEAKSKITMYDEFMNFYDDTYLFDEIIQEIKSRKYEFVVIDFIQNIVKLGLDEYSRLSFIALELQKLAKECNCCILLLSQLSNAISRMGEKAPPEYKGSGSIATVADLAFFIEREVKTDIDWNDKENLVRIYLRKNRRGIAGVYWEYKFIQPGGRIENEPEAKT